MKHRFLVLIIVCAFMAATVSCSRHRSVAVTPRQFTAAGYQGVNASGVSAPVSTSLSDYITGVLKISQENTAAAEQSLKQLLEQRPDLAALAKRAAQNASDVEARRTLADAYIQEGLYPFAFQMYQEIQTARPNDPSAEAGIAQVWDHWGDYNVARQHAERAATIDPKSVEALEVLGKIHLHRNEMDQALSAFLSALAIEPQNVSLLTNAGYAFLKRGDLTQARNYLEQAISIDGSPVEAHNNLAITLARLGDQDGALREFMAVNEPAAAFNNLGVVYMGQKRWREARDAFQRALALDPSYTMAQTNLAEVKLYLPPPTVITLPGPADSRSDTVATRSDSKPAKVPAGKAADMKVGMNAAKAKDLKAPASRSDASMSRTEKNSRILIAYRDALERFRAKRYREAKEIFTWLLTQYPNDSLASNCQYWIGESYFAVADYKQAYAAFRRVMLYSNSEKRNDALLMMRNATIKQRQKARSTKI